MFTTTVSGEDQIINRMKAFNGDVWRALQKDVKAGADIIGQSARGMIPANPTSPSSTPGWGSGGRLGWNASAVQSSIKAKFRSRTLGGRRYVLGVVDTNSAAGSLWSLAGSKTQTQFGDIMTNWWGSAAKGHGPRAMAPAWTMHVDEAREQIQKSVDEAARKVAF